jgi:hypothetical protein
MVISYMVGDVANKEHGSNFKSQKNDFFFFLITWLIGDVENKVRG